MANFKVAFDITMGHEGGYSNDPNDAGGETYRGISRVYHPTWEGWEGVDAIKAQGGIPSRTNDGFLEPLVRVHYKAYYWDVNRCGEMPQAVAEEVFDTGVNMGVARAAVFLQQALNCLNRGGERYPDLVEDGVVGPKTLRALDALLLARAADQRVLLKIMNVLQGAHYIEYMRRSWRQERYARGWFERVDIGKVPPLVEV